MTDACYYHPDVPAADTCAQCGMRICADCREQISGRSVCHQCVGIMRTRLEREMAAAPPIGAYPGSGSSPSSSPASLSTPNAPHAGRTAIGIVVGLLIGIVGAIVIEKISLHGFPTLSYFYVVLGYGIGWGIHQATGRGGAKMALIAVGLMVASLLVSHIVLAYDVLTAVQAAGDADPSLRVTDVFPFVMKEQGILHWVCIAIGLYACYRGVERR